MNPKSISIEELKALLPKPYNPEWDILDSTTNKEDFNEAAFKLLKQCSQVCVAIAGIQIKESIGRNQAICTGLAIRLTKLARIVIRDFSGRETFQQLTIARQVFETASTLIYLLNDKGDNTRFDKFVQDSLVSEKVMLEDVERNIIARGGKALEIEKRLRKSIEKTAEAAGIQEISQLPARKNIGYPNIEERMKYLGNGVYGAYRSGSSEVHGNWTDLYKHHLIEVGRDAFLPNPDNPEVQPNVATTTTSVLARVFSAYLDWLGVSYVVELYDPVLTQIINKNDRLVEAHENYISRISSL